MDKEKQTMQQETAAECSAAEDAIKAQAPQEVREDAAQANAVTATVEEQGEQPSPMNGAKKQGLRKQLLIVILSVVLVLAILAAVILANLLRGRRPPELESVRARFEELVEESFAVNELLFGKGLATYPRVDATLLSTKVECKGGTHTIYYKLFRDSEQGLVVAYWYYVIIPEKTGDKTTYVTYDIATEEMLEPGYATFRYAQKSKQKREGYLHHDEKSGYYYYPIEGYVESDFQYSSEDEPEYDYVKLDEPYQTVDEIKAAAERVYSKAYLSTIYEGLFTGIASGDSDTLLFARYREKKKDDVMYLQMANVVEGIALPERRYDYSTMQIAKGSKAKYVLVEMESYIVGEEQNRTVVQLAFALEDGNWYLDSPSY